MRLLGVIGPMKEDFLIMLHFELWFTVPLQRSLISPDSSTVLNLPQKVRPDSLLRCQNMKGNLISSDPLPCRNTKKQILKSYFLDWYDRRTSVTESPGKCSSRALWIDNKLNTGSATVHQLGRIAFWFLLASLLFVTHLRELSTNTAFLIVL